MPEVNSSVWDQTPLPICDKTSFKWTVTSPLHSESQMKHLIPGKLSTLLPYIVTLGKLLHSSET